MFFLAEVAYAAAPDRSARPVQRGGNVSVTAAAAVAAAQVPRQHSVSQSLRPMFRSKKAERSARDLHKMRARGAVCGDLSIQGEEIGRVKGKLRGCGVDEAVRVRSVSGVRLSQNSVMDCRTAKSLKRWLDQTAIPSFARAGGGLKGIKVAAHYSCRTRNNKSGAKISEHGKGRAIDISAFRLQNGAEITVLEGWRARNTKKVMRRLHKGACGPFGTVLGPNADRYHQDHFHFDTARYRSGTYCR